MILTRRRLLQLGATASLAPLLAGCTLPWASGPSKAELLAGGNTIALERLIAEAQKEGVLTTMALPHDWANYGEILSTYKSHYQLTINELAPESSSGEELEAIRKNQRDGTTEAPDVLDIGVGFTEVGKEERLFAPYKPATWDTIPEALKEQDGYWCGAYYGVLALETNLTTIKNIPQDWSDLLRPEYKQSIALAGDPTVSSQGIHSVWAAGLSITSSLEDAPQAGLEFFAELHRLGNFIPTIAELETLARGETPIVVQWDYLGLTNRDTLKGSPEVAVVVPQTGVLAGLYVQAINAYAAHPFAARLWQEFLFSDEGQLLWLKGYVHPVRYDDLVKNHKVPLELASKLPPAETYVRAIFPTLAQITTANKIISENWRKVVLREG